MPLSSNLDEVRRLQYLQLLGVSSYYPRFVLPGAQASTACAWPEQEQPAARVAVAEMRLAEPVTDKGLTAAGSATPEEAAQARPRMQVLEPAEAGQRADTAQQRNSANEMVGRRPQSAESRSRQAGTTETGLSLQVLLLRVDARLALLCQVPVLARPQLAPHQQQLLGNILRWLGTAADPGDARTFRWPLPGLALTNTAQEAGLGLQRFLEQSHIERPFGELVLFGSQAADCLLPVQASAAAAVSWQQVTTHSLDELLAQPQLKRECWQALLPLRARLSAG